MRAVFETDERFIMYRMLSVFEARCDNPLGKGFGLVHRSKRSTGGSEAALTRVDVDPEASLSARDSSRAGEPWDASCETGEGYPLV